MPEGVEVNYVNGTVLAWRLQKAIGVALFLGVCAAWPALILLLFVWAFTDMIFVGPHWSWRLAFSLIVTFATYGYVFVWHRLELMAQRAARPTKIQPSVAWLATKIEAQIEKRSPTTVSVLSVTSEVQ